MPASRCVAVLSTVSVPQGVTLADKEFVLHWADTDLRDLAGENEVRYEYEYDSCGHWTQQTENHSYGPDSPSNVRHRTLTYY